MAVAKFFATPEAAQSFIDDLDPGWRAEILPSGDAFVVSHWKPAKQTSAADELNRIRLEISTYATGELMSHKTGFDAERALFRIRDWVDGGCVGDLDPENGGS